MDTTNDTKMQHVTDAVIEELRKMQPTAWVYEDMLGRKCVGFERPLHRSNTHEPLFSAANHAVIVGLINLLDEAEKERDALRAEIEELHVLIAAVKKQANAEFCLRVKKEEEYARLRAKVESMERQAPVGEIVAFGESLHEVSWNRGKLPPLGAKIYALPGAQGEEKWTT